MSVIALAISIDWPNQNSDVTHSGLTHACPSANIHYIHSLFYSCTIHLFDLMHVSAFWSLQILCLWLLPLFKKTPEKQNERSCHIFCSTLWRGHMKNRERSVCQCTVNLQPRYWHKVSALVQGYRCISCDCSFFCRWHHRMRHPMGCQSWSVVHSNMLVRKEGVEVLLIAWVWWMFCSWSGVEACDLLASSR